MRFVPDVNTLMNYSKRAKTTQLAARQLAFEGKMGYVNLWEIIDLFSKDKEIQMSLATMITQIPSTKLPHLNVFHAVSPGYQQGTTTFTFIPQLEEEAQTMVAALLPFLRNKHGDGVFKFFTPAAGDRALSCEWDSTTNQVISPSDQAVQDATTLDEDYYFEAIEIIMPTKAPAPTGGTAAFAQDTDSVSTF